MSGGRSRLALAALMAAGLVLAPLAGCKETDGMAAAETNPKAEGPDGLPIIFWTIKENDQKKVAAILDAGGDIEAKGYHKATPILAAAIVDNWEMAAFLMKRGARLDAVDGRGFTLPYLAAQAKVAEGSPTAAALQEVRVALNERAMLEKIYLPAEVRQMLKDGRWPPQ